MAETPQPLTAAQAVPGARIASLRHGWKATIQRAAWPALWVVFDSDRLQGREDERHVWAHAFTLILEEDAACSPTSSAISARTITNPTTPPASSSGASPGEGEQHP